MIDRKFIDYWSNRYDLKCSERDRALYKQIKNKLNKLFPSGKIRYLTRDILYDVVDWKASRIRKSVLSNKPAFVKEISRCCLLSRNEQLKIEALAILKGVKYRVASAILHFCFPEKYTVMDWRAWESLIKQKELAKTYKIKDDFEHWHKYLKTCRSICTRCNRTLRQLDKALWQYSKEDYKNPKSL